MMAKVHACTCPGDAAFHCVVTGRSCGSCRRAVAKCKELLLVTAFVPSPKLYSLCGFISTIWTSNHSRTHRANVILSTIRTPRDITKKNKNKNADKIFTFSNMSDEKMEQLFFFFFSYAT